MTKFFTFLIAAILCAAYAQATEKLLNEKRQSKVVTQSADRNP
jgi:hypothetical protein